jgi:hypothetical protein
MKNKLANPILMIAAGLLVACSAITKSETLPANQLFPTPTTHFLLQGNAPIATLDAPVALSGAPTVASVFRTSSSATPSPIIMPTTTLEFTETPLPQATASQLFTLPVYDDDLNPNWEVQEDTRMRIDLKSSSEVYRGDAAISFAPRRNDDATLFITVSDQSMEEYRRDQVAKLSFWLYSPKALLYLDQFFITFVGSKRLPYWSLEDQKVANYLSVFPRISLDKLGFDRAVPADTWVMVEIDFDEVRALAPEYQYLTGISFQNATDPTHPLLLDDISLTLLGKPTTRSTLDPTPTSTAPSN